MTPCKPSSSNAEIVASVIRLAQAFEERGFTAYPHSAEHAMLEPEQAERHRKLADMRDAGKTSPPEFDALYAEEAAWLAANDIAYYPPLGWHYTR